MTKLRDPEVEQHVQGHPPSYEMNWYLSPDNLALESRLIIIMQCDEYSLELLGAFDIIEGQGPKPFQISNPVNATVVYNFSP